MNSWHINTRTEITTNKSSEITLLEIATEIKKFTDNLKQKFDTVEIISVKTFVISE